MEIDKGVFEQLGNLVQNANKMKSVFADATKVGNEFSKSNAEHKPFIDSIVSDLNNPNFDVEKLIKKAQEYASRINDK